MHSPSSRVAILRKGFLLAADRQPKLLAVTSLSFKLALVALVWQMSASCCLFVWFGCSGFGWVVTSYQRCLNTFSHLPGFWNTQLKTKSLVSPALWIAEPKAQVFYTPREESNLLITSDKRKFPQDRNKLWKYKIIICCKLFLWQHRKDVRTGSRAGVNQGNVIDCGEAALIYTHWWFDPLSLRS